jgi:hypothetical protein
MGVRPFSTRRTPIVGNDGKMFLNGPTQLPAQ